MKKLTVYLTGSHGYLGLQIKKHLEDLGCTVIRCSVDLSTTTPKNVCPNVIVNCAIDKRESKVAYRNNINMIKNLEKMGVPIVHFSCYFCGKGEEGNPNRKWYNKSKRKQEKLISKSWKNKIIRIGNIIESPNNVIQKVINSESEITVTIPYRLKFEHLDSILNKLDCCLDGMFNDSLYTTT